MPSRARAEHGWIDVEPDHIRVPERPVEEPVLDLLGSERHETQRMGMVRLGGTGEIQNAENVALRTEDRNGRAAQDPVAFEIMFCAAHLDRAALGQGGSDRIGPDNLLTPGHTRPQSHLGSALGEVETADGVENEA